MPSIFNLDPVALLYNSNALRQLSLRLPSFISPDALRFCKTSSFVIKQKRDATGLRPYNPLPCAPLLIPSHWLYDRETNLKNVLNYQITLASKYVTVADAPPASMKRRGLVFSEPVSVTISLVSLSPVCPVALVAALADSPLPAPKI